MIHVTNKITLWAQTVPCKFKVTWPFDTRASAPVGVLVSSCRVLNRQSTNKFSIIFYCRLFLSKICLPSCCNQSKSNKPWFLQFGQQRQIFMRKSLAFRFARPNFHPLCAHRTHTVSAHGGTRTQSFTLTAVGRSSQQVESSPDNTNKLDRCVEIRVRHQRAFITLDNGKQKCNGKTIWKSNCLFFILLRSVTNERLDSWRHKFYSLRVRECAQLKTGQVAHAGHVGPTGEFPAWVWNNTAVSTNHKFRFGWDPCSWGRPLSRKLHWSSHRTIRGWGQNFGFVVILLETIRSLVPIVATKMWALLSLEFIVSWHDLSSMGQNMCQPAKLFWYIFSGWVGCSTQVCARMRTKISARSHVKSKWIRTNQISTPKQNCLTRFESGWNVCCKWMEIDSNVAGDPRPFQADINPGTGNIFQSLRYCLCLWKIIWRSSSISVSIAQSAVRSAVNRKVVGSSPAGDGPKTFLFLDRLVRWLCFAIHSHHIVCRSRSKMPGEPGPPAPPTLV